jgi:uncharacterized membrane protein YfcA
MFWLLAVLMGVVAVIFSALGQGGGVLYTPIQVWLGIDFHTAAATSLFLIMTLSLSSSLVFRKAGKIDWPLALMLETVSIAGGVSGGLWSGRVAEHLLMLMFAGILVISAVLMVSPFGMAPECGDRAGGFFNWRRTTGGQTYCVNLALAFPVSYAAGLASGMVGIGGGVFKIPMMVLLFGIPMDIAIGSSALMVGMTAAGGFAGHLVSGHWDWRMSLVLAVVVFAGGQIGSRLSLRVDNDRVKVFYGWFLVIIAGTMVLKSIY